MLKKIVLGILAVLVIAQFFRIDKNDSGASDNDISTKYAIPEGVKTSLKNACYDCHSNRTNYPWYTEIQPVGWWLNGHVNEGKRHLNFSEFMSRRIAFQNHGFEEIAETVEEGEMPLSSYTWFGLHGNANLSDAEKNELVTWAKAQMQLLKNTYPADSLKMPERRRR